MIIMHDQLLRIHIQKVLHLKVSLQLCEHLLHHDILLLFFLSTLFKKGAHSIKLVLQFKINDFFIFLEEHPYQAVVDGATIV